MIDGDGESVLQVQELALGERTFAFEGATDGGGEEGGARQVLAEVIVKVFSQEGKLAFEVGDELSRISGWKFHSGGCKRLTVRNSPQWIEAISGASDGRELGGITQ